MTRKPWPMQFLPGMSPFPDGYRAPVKRKPTRKRAGGTLTLQLQAEHTTSKPIGRLIIDDPHEHHPTVDRRKALAWFAETFPREPGRPVTYDHPLALAARAGRKHALWSGPEPMFATDAERRAFEVARARKLAWRRGER